MSSPNSSQRKHLAIVASYGHFLPPRNGGHLRTFHLIRGLAKEFDITVISHTPPTEENRQILKAAGMETVSLIGSPNTWRTHPPGLLKRMVARLQYVRLTRDWRGPTNSSVLQFRRDLRKLLKTETISAIILEGLPPVCFQSLAPDGKAQPAIIFNAHNVNSSLLKQALKDVTDKSEKQKRERHYQAQLKIDRELSCYTDACLTCSEDDLRTLQDLSRPQLKGCVIPNGVDIASHPFQESRETVNPKQILFCGSLFYQPNTEGLIWFIQEVWPQLASRGLQFKIIGRGRIAPQLKALCEHSHVELIGEVPSTLPYYQESAIAIVPLLSGSGTRLKILEAMALGTPIVSTTLGAEGIDCTPAEISLADTPEAFAAAIIDLLTHPEKPESQRTHARKRIEQTYDWNSIGKNAISSIKEIIKN